MKSKRMVELRKNIKILDVYANSDSLIGINIYVKITDNNKKIFKNKKLRIEVFGVDNGDDVKKYVEKEIESYIYYNYRREILNEEIDKAMEEYKAIY